jgi:hypothetical protein
MKKKALKYLILFILIVFSIIVIIWMFRLDRLGFSNLKWGDYIKFNGITYEGQYTDNNDRISIDASLVAKKIGETDYKLQGNVHSTFYQMRNRDATLLDRKTELYQIQSENVDVSIAVKIGSSYYLYSKR